MPHFRANFRPLDSSRDATATTTTWEWDFAGLMSASGVIRAAPRTPKRMGLSESGASGGLAAYDAVSGSDQSMCGLG